MSDANTARDAMLSRMTAALARGEDHATDMAEALKLIASMGLAKPHVIALAAIKRGRQLATGASGDE